MTTPTGSSTSAALTGQRLDAASDTLLPPDTPPSAPRQPAIRDMSSAPTDRDEASTPERYSVGDHERRPSASPRRFTRDEAAASPRNGRAGNSTAAATVSPPPARTWPGPAVTTPSATVSTMPEGAPSSSSTSNAPASPPLLPGVTRDELKHLLDAYDTRTLDNGTRLSRSSDQDRQNMVRLGADLERSLTGYPPGVQHFEQKINDMQAQLSTLPPGEHEAYAGALATLDAASRYSTDAAELQRVDRQLSLLGSALLERSTTAINDPVQEALNVFNRPVGAGYLTQPVDQQKLGALTQLRGWFVTASTPVARQLLFSEAAELKSDLQHKIGTAIDQHTTQETGKWAAANGEVNRIVHEAEAIKDDPGKRFELIGRQLYSANPGSGRDELADRRLLAFTQQMRDDPSLHDELASWSVAAGRKLNASGVDGPKSYLDILNNLPPAGPDYVRDLADQYNAVLHDTSYKDYSITPRARGEKLAEQVFEGATRFLLGLTPFAPVTAALDPHSSLSPDTRLGIDLASGLLGLVAGGGEAAFGERLAAKEAGAIINAASEEHLPAGGKGAPLPAAAAIQSGQAGQAGVQSARPAAHAAAQGLSVDAAVVEASQRISGTKASLPDSYAVQPAADSLKAATGSKNVLIDNNGQHYISSGGKTYPARFDVDNNTWRVYQPDNAYRPQYPVRLNAQGDWEVHHDVGLKGGMNPSGAPMPVIELTPPFAEAYQVSTPGGAPPSADILQTLNAPSWHSAADRWPDDKAFVTRYKAAFNRLPPEQQAALRNWTHLDDSGPYASGGSYQDVNYDLNRQLRTGAHQSDTTARADALRAGLDGLPKPEGTNRLIRVANVPSDYAGRFAPGDYVTSSPAFMSASSLNTYAEAAVTEGRTVAGSGQALALYDIQSESATPFVNRISTLAEGEREWLFKPGTVFRVEEVAVAAPRDATRATRIGIRLVEVPVTTPINAKNIYTGAQELVYPPGMTPV